MRFTVDLPNCSNASGKILTSPLSILSISINLWVFLPPASLQRGTLFNLWSEKRTRGKKPLPLLHLFYFITSLLGKLGQLCSPAYLFTFSLQDYIGIIIVFYGAFFWCFTLFEGPVDLGRWRKMDPFWGIRLLRDKMQLHTGSFFFSTLCFPPGANLWGCSILELEWYWSKHNTMGK